MTNYTYKLDTMFLRRGLLVRRGLKGECSGAGQVIDNVTICDIVRGPYHQATPISRRKRKRRSTDLDKHSLIIDEVVVVDDDNYD